MENEAQLVYRRQDACSVHYMQPSPWVDIQYVEKGSGRWTATGVGVCLEPGCNYAVQTVTEYLPIEFPALPCPTCKQVVRYEYALECVEMQSRPTEFVFAASVTCPRCSKTSVFRKIINSFRQIKRIKVGPTGIELEVQNPASTS
jgi:endogenous inhibitor of DNA gyrase (YacG/DUF329 family)